MKLQVWRNVKEQRYLVELDDAGQATFASGPKTKLDVAYAIACLDEAQAEGSKLRWDEERTFRNRQLAQLIKREDFVVEWEREAGFEAAA